MRRIPPRRLAAEQRGVASISTLFLIGALVALVYAILGAGSGDTDLYGRIAVPSTALISLPTEEADISYIEPSPAVGEPRSPPKDLRIIVRNPQTREPIRVNSKGGSVVEEGGEAVTPVSRTDPPGAGVYEVIVTSSQARARPAPQLAFGEGPVGAITGRFSNIGELITGPAGIVAALLLLAALAVPPVQRALVRLRQ